MTSSSNVVLGATGALFIVLGAYVPARNPHPLAARSFFFSMTAPGAARLLQTWFDPSLDNDQAPDRR